MTFIRSIAFGVLLLLLNSCVQSSKVDVPHRFEAAFGDKVQSKKLKEIDFRTFESLNLGFYRGYVWIKLDIINGPRIQSYIVVNQDLMSHDYRFYKYDSIHDELDTISPNGDWSRKDARSHNFPNPNFGIELEPLEKATYYIKLYSDGRFIDATPRLMDLDDYTNFINRKTISSYAFLLAVILLLLINFYQWRLLKQKIYLFYLLYMLSTFIMYMGLEGFWHSFGWRHIYIDHIIFISVRLWILFLMIYTLSFLDTKIVAPRYFKLLNWLLIIVLGGSTLYQIIFFNSSIAGLHFYENTMSFVWLCLIVITLIMSARKKSLELKFYLIPLSCFLLFTIIGLIDGHLQSLPGDPLLYIKTGTIIEFIGYTYLLTRLLKNKLRKSEYLKTQLNENRKELESVSEKLDALMQQKSTQQLAKTDLLGIFKLLEHSISDDNAWNEFKEKFESLNPNFLNNLNVTHSDLSKSEIRLITLIKIDYSQKEIAEILNIEPNSVKKAKSRVRKKLNISSSTLLKDYLSKF